MASFRIECLHCGEVRRLDSSSHHGLNGGDCPRCGYVGWAPSAEVDETTRRLLRERPLQRRRLHAA
jgi:DNA-directed RNA polymerase subunit RPC12/RpoP